jgi:hypothetical protein
MCNDKGEFVVEFFDEQFFPVQFILPIKIIRMQREEDF